MDVSIGSMLTKTQRLILGLFVLLLVDVIWVSTSELTKYLYHNEEFGKPFFNTYFQTSLFTLYLLGLCFWPPWREQFNKPANYMFIDPNLEDENFYTDANITLSNPTYVPVKTPEIDRSSGTESDDSSIRSVRFNKLAEVRHMSDSNATDALLARLSYQASIRIGELARRAATKLPIIDVAKVSFVFCLLWFVSNYTYQLSVSDSESGTIAIWSSTSSLFTLLLGSAFPSNIGDKFTLSKLVAVFISISGLVLVSLSDMSFESRIPTDILLAILSGFFYAIYLIYLRRKVDHEDKMDIPLFFGFVGLFNLILLWPLFFFLHFSSWELFELPDKHQLVFLIVQGLVGTVLSDVLWLWGCFLTSSLIATLALSLTIPMSMFADVLLKRVSYPCMFYVGTVPMVAAFCAAILLAHFDNWDPVLEFLRWWHVCVCRRSRTLRIAESEVEQTEALIGINCNEHEA